MAAMQASMQTTASLPECILLDGGLGHEWKRQSGDESFLESRRSFEVEVLKRKKRPG